MKEEIAKSEGRGIRKRRGMDEALEKGGVFTDVDHKGFGRPASGSLNDIG